MPDKKVPLLLNPKEKFQNLTSITKDGFYKPIVRVERGNKS